MKVLFYSYPSAFQNPGGGEVQLLKTKQALERKGVQVKLFNQWSDSLRDYDVMHVFGSVKDCVGLMQTARNAGIMVALSTIFWSSFKRAWYESPSAGRKIELLSRHALKCLVPAFPSGRRKTFNLADVLLPNSQAEAAQLTRLFAVPKNKIFVVPNGVDERFKDAKPDAFLKKFGLRGFVLAVGRIEPRKNQLNLIKAFRNVSKDLVIIGEPVSDYPGYFQRCKESSGSNVHYLGGLAHESELLASAYAACGIFVAPGWFETPGLAALEAGLAGAKLALTKFGCTREYFQDSAAYFDPSDAGQIKRALMQAEKKDNSDNLSLRIIKYYSWDKVAEATIAAYKKGLEKK